MNQHNLLSIKSVSKHYRRGNTLVTAVDKISLNLKRGDILLIKGPSGSGKTTLLTLIGLLLRQSSGTILYNGKNMAEFNEDQRAEFRLRKIGFIFQSFNLIPALNAQENIAIAGNLNKLKQSDQKAVDLLKKLGIKDRAKHLPEELSGGERQRVAVARALVNDPEIILADEPTANLDSKSGQDVIDMLCQIACEQNNTVIIVSHDERIERSVKRIITIEDGRLGKSVTGGHEKTCTHHGGADYA